MLIAQQVDDLSAGDTAVRFLPMGVIGFIASLGTGKLLEYMNGKYLLLAGLILTVVAPVPSALTVTSTDNLYVHVVQISGTLLTAPQLDQHPCHIIDQHHSCFPHLRHDQHNNPDQCSGRRQESLWWNGKFRSLLVSETDR